MNKQLKKIIREEFSKLINEDNEEEILYDNIEKINDSISDNERRLKYEAEDYRKKEKEIQKAQKRGDKDLEAKLNKDLYLIYINMDMIVDALSQDYYYKHKFQEELGIETDGDVHTSIKKANADVYWTR